MELTSKELSARLSKEPLLFAQVATFNAPELVAERLANIGVQHEANDGADILDVLMEVSPQLSPKQLIYVFDFPFYYADDPSEKVLGIFDSYKIAAENMDLDVEQSTWSSLFESSAASIGEANADFNGGAKNLPVLSSQPMINASCQICAIRRLRNIIYALIGILLLMTLIKKW